MGNVRKNVEGDKLEMLPEDPEKIIKFVLLFLPGFIALGFTQYVSGLQVDEYAFTYLSVAISIFIFVVSAPISRLLHRLFRSKKETGLSFIFISVIAINTAISGFIIAKFYEHDTLLRWVSSVGDFDRESHLPPSLLILGQSPDVLDARPEELRGDKIWLRVHLPRGAVYEGNPRYYPTSREAVEFFLSPACRIVGEAPMEKVEKIPGPGVLVLEKDIGPVELMDEGESQCCNEYFGSAKCGTNNKERPQEIFYP